MSTMNEIKAKLVAAALPHVPFDGWSAQTFEAAILDSAVQDDLARVACPRGAVDLAISSHEAGDARFVENFDQGVLDGLRYSEKVMAAVRLRIEMAGDAEVVRRASSLFAMPHLAATGGQLIWNTADVIWSALGDTSDDVNWYSKRAILSGVYASTLLFWLGDTSADKADTWAFLERRIDDVMRFEKTKAQLNENKLVGPLLRGPLQFLSRIKAPDTTRFDDLPGHITPRT